MEKIISNPSNSVYIKSFNFLITDTRNNFESIMEDSIISHSNGMSSAMPNLIIMTDSQDNFHQKDGQKSQNQTCKSRGMFQCRSNEAQCYNFLQICDHVCDCTKDCIDENQCLETLSPSPWPWAEKSETSLILQGNLLGSITMRTNLLN